MQRALSPIDRTEAMGLYVLGIGFGIMIGASMVHDELRQLAARQRAEQIAHAILDPFTGKVGPPFPMSEDALHEYELQRRAMRPDLAGDDDE